MPEFEELSSGTAIDAILQRFERFGIQLGLKRMQHLLAALGNPQQKVPILHVAGTNGKGSVCAYLSSVLTEAGYRVGRYTSPHLMNWNERICLNDRPIATDRLLHLLQQVERAIAVPAAMQPIPESPTKFEVITAAAWLYFAQEQVDLAVMEVGLGGRLDATNVCDRVLASIITSISYDHCEYLGNTLAAIAREKAAILKPDCPAAIGPLPPEARSVVEEQLRACNCPTLWPEPAIALGHNRIEYRPPHIIGGHQTSTSKPLNPLQYSLPLAGTVQLTNSALAIAALQILQQKGWRISDAAIATGIANTHWPGRLQQTTWNDRPLILDGAHNPAAARALKQTLQSQIPQPDSPAKQLPIAWVIGILANKDCSAILSALLQPRDRLHLVPIPGQNFADPNTLAGLALKLCPGLSHCQPYPDLPTALEHATQIPTKPHLPNPTIHPSTRPTVLCGSLYLISHFLTYRKHSK